MGNYRILYDRSFNAYPEFEYKGRVVVGACVGLLFKFYKNGEEVFFEEGSECSVCHNVICSFDKDAENCCQLWLKPYLVESWFDEMTYEVSEWELMVYAGSTRDLFPDFPEAYGDYPVSESMWVSQEEFVQVLREHWESFDNTDNLSAECLSMGYVNVP